MTIYEDGAYEDKKAGSSERPISVPRYGAYHVALTWLAARIFSIFALLTVIGVLMYSVIVHDRLGPNLNEPLVIGIALATISAIYSITVTLIWFTGRPRLLWLMMIVDLAWLGTFCFLAVIFSEPAVSRVCHTSVDPHLGAASQTTSSSALAGDLSTRLSKRGNATAFRQFVLASHISCGTIMAIWIPCVALAVLFTSTAVLSPLLRYYSRKTNRVTGD